MRRLDMDTAVRRVRDVRLALAALLVLSMTANLALTLSFVEPARDGVAGGVVHGCALRRSPCRRAR